MTTHDPTTSRQRPFVPPRRYTKMVIAIAVSALLGLSPSPAQAAAPSASHAVTQSVALIVPRATNAIAASDLAAANRAMATELTTLAALPCPRVICKHVRDVVYPGGKWVAKKVWQHGKWATKKVSQGGKWVAKKVYQGGRWVAKKVWQMGKWTVRQIYRAGKWIVVDKVWRTGKNWARKVWRTGKERVDEVNGTAIVTRCSGRIIESHPLRAVSGVRRPRTVGRVDLYWSAATRANCVQAYDLLPGRSQITATLAVQGRGSVSDSGSYETYAGGAWALAQHKCVRFDATVSRNDGRWEYHSGWGHCR